ncbi:hypothetical protein SAMN05421741_10855 [Paenimyroides ummariense]|uniref:PH domain-containing protein n=1 Tax=Paenimyroides ummariense TaxID=913024 RepID=A0A1I5AI22_9FLAO|nr:hypothetical protein [Paenimyroides ummariense]SFN62077.1 hypothetical protein SAMN05421741_10855 [Paenimyroides ummariense]
MKPLFIEKQRFNQWWLWLLLMISLAVPVLLLFKEATIKSGGFSGIIIIVLVIILFVIMQLKTTITQQNIQLTYFPFVWKTIKLSDIDTMKVINYGFVGGWGIRLWTKYGTVYNVRGNKGLHIRLKNGKQLVIGTQKPQELENVVAQLNSK